jgi:hypothetical protein
VDPKSDVTNSKKIKKYETFARRHFMWPRCGKNSNLEKKSLTENPFTKMTYHVRGCTTFRLNELDLALRMA